VDVVVAAAALDGAQSSAACEMWWSPHLLSRPVKEVRVGNYGVRNRVGLTV
jgi:hypothetical protein